MNRRVLAVLAVVMLLGCGAAPPVASAPPAAPSPAPGTNVDADTAAVEARIRAFEDAWSSLDADAAQKLVEPDFRKVEGGYPGPWSDYGTFLHAVRGTGFHMHLRVHDVSVHVKGDVAWATVINEATNSADNDKARVLVRRCREAPALNPCESHVTFVESEVWLRHPDGWRMAFIHVTSPSSPDKLEALAAQLAAAGYTELAQLERDLAQATRSHTESAPDAPVDVAATVRKQIEQTDGRIVETLKRGDAAACAAFYTTDGELLLDGVEQPVKGRAAIQSVWQSMAGKVKDASIVPTEVEVYGETAYEKGNTTLTLSGPKPGTMRVKYVVIWKRQPDGSWQIFRDIGNSNGPSK